MPNPDPSYVQAVLRYDPETGKMFWNERPAAMFADTGPGGRNAAAQSWNKRFAGTEALTVPHANGYLSGTLFGRKVLAHRAAWVIHHGEWPKDQIDHINGDRTDNRIANLRDVDASMNMLNTKTRVDCSSGYQGVTWCQRDRRWIVQVAGFSRTGRVGMFKTLPEAVHARDQARIGMGFTARGEAA